MNDSVSLRFESRLAASKEAVWAWMVSVQGISAELRPLLRMTVPKGVQSLADVRVRPGVRLFRSHVFLFGLIPFDYSDLTLLELNEGRGFVEQSPMGSMKLWRHERWITPSADTPGVTTLTDQLTFRPRTAPRFVAWVVEKIFNHRHKVIRAHFGA